MVTQHDNALFTGHPTVGNPNMALPHLPGQDSEFLMECVYVSGHFGCEQRKAVVRTPTSEEEPTTKIGSKQKRRNLCTTLGHTSAKATNI